MTRRDADTIDSDESRMPVARRDVLRAAPALAATVAVGSTPGMAARTAEFSPLAAAVSGYLWTPPDAVSIPKYGSESVPAFHIELDSDESWSTLDDWVADRDSRSEHSRYRHDASQHTVVAANPYDVGINGFRTRSDTLLQAVDVEWIDVVQYTSLIEPVPTIPSGPDAADLPRSQTLHASIWQHDTGIDDGLAYSEDITESTLQDARQAANTDSVTLQPTGTTSTVAVIDTGVNDTSAMDDTTGSTRILDASKDYAGSGDTGVDAVEDGNGHGTWVAEAIAGDSDDDTKHDGWAPDASVLAVKVLSDDGRGTSADVAAGVRYAADQDADVANLSLGGLYSDAIDRAISYAAGAGTVPVAATGNARLQGRYVGHPASSPDAIGVAATTADAPADLKVASFSNPGPQPGTTDLSAGQTEGADPSIGAPGTEIRTATRPHLSGTSMAAPQVAGAAVWILEDTDASTPDEVADRLTTYPAPAENAGVTDVGNGVLDIAAALDETEPSSSQKDARTGKASARDDANRARSDAAGGALTRWFA